MWCREASQQKSPKGTWCDVASGCGRSWTFHMTTVGAAELTILELFFHICFQSNTQTPFITGRRYTLLQSLDFRVHSPTIKHGGFLFTNLRGVVSIRRAGPVLWCGLRLSWVIKEPPPLFPLEKLTEPSHMKTAQPCKSYCLRQLPYRGDFYESHRKKSYHSVSFCLCLKVFWVSTT